MVLEQDFEMLFRFDSQIFENSVNYINWRFWKTVCFFEEIKPKIISGGWNLQKNLFTCFSEVVEKWLKIAKTASTEKLSFWKCCISIHKKFWLFILETGKNFRRDEAESNLWMSESTKNCRYLIFESDSKRVKNFIDGSSKNWIFWNVPFKSTKNFGIWISRRRSWKI
mgnify:CR=1 FL=1